MPHRFPVTDRGRRRASGKTRRGFRRLNAASEERSARAAPTVWLRVIGLMETDSPSQSIDNGVPEKTVPTPPLVRVIRSVSRPSLLVLGASWCPESRLEGGAVVLKRIVCSVDNTRRVPRHRLESPRESVIASLSRWEWFVDGNVGWVNR